MAEGEGQRGRVVGGGREGGRWRGREGGKVGGAEREGDGGAEREGRWRGREGGKVGGAERREEEFGKFESAETGRAVEDAMITADYEVVEVKTPGETEAQ